MSKRRSAAEILIAGACGLFALCSCGSAPRTVEIGQILADPVAAARAAAESGDWRLVAARTPEGRMLEGVRCSIPGERWSLVTRDLSVEVATDVAPVRPAGPDAPESRRAAARFNTLLVADPAAPYRALCSVGGATAGDGNGGLLDGGRRRIADWAVLNPLPPQASLIAAVRAGQADRTAILPLDSDLEPDFLGFGVLGWAAIRDDQRLLLRFARDQAAAARVCDHFRRRDDESEPWRIRNRDPVGIAVDRGHARAAGLLIGMLSPARCPDGEDGHSAESALRDALYLAQEKRDQAMIVALVRGYYAGDRSWSTMSHLSRWARRFLDAGLRDAAAAVAAMIPPGQGRHHPLVSASSACDLAKVRLWLAVMTERREDVLAEARGAVERQPVRRLQGSDGSECPAVLAALAG